MSKHNKSKKTACLIIKEALNNLLGKEQIQQLGLLQVVNRASSETIKKCHPTLFPGLKTLKKNLKIMSTRRPHHLT